MASCAPDLARDLHAADEDSRGEEEEIEASDLVSDRKRANINALRNKFRESTGCQAAMYFVRAALRTEIDDPLAETDVQLASERVIAMNSDPGCGVVDVSGLPLAKTGFSAYPQTAYLWSSYLDPITNARLTEEAKAAMLSMMWRSVNHRSTLILANRTAFDTAGSENHNAIHSSAIFLALQGLLYAPSYGPNVRLADNHTVKEHYIAWTGYWMRYFRDRSREGLQIEFSPTYTRYTLASYYPIRDFARSRALRRQAGAFLDLYWTDVAQELLPNGLRGGAETRAYKGVLTMSGYSLRGWLAMYDWFDTPGLLPGNDFSILLPSTSTYRPPEIARAIARDHDKPPYAYISRRFGRLDVGAPKIVVNGDTLERMTVQGGSFLKRYSYVTPEYVLGTHQYDATKTYSSLTDQNRVMSAIFTDDLDFGAQISVFGRVFETVGCGVTGSAEINGIAGPNTMVVGHDPRHQPTYSSGTRIYLAGALSDNLAAAPESGWLFTTNGKAHAAIRIAVGGYTTTQAAFRAKVYAPGDHPSEGGDGTFTCTSPQLAKGRFLELEDMWSPIVIQLGRAVDYASYEAFKAQILRTYWAYDTVRQALTYKSPNGDLYEYWRQSQAPPQLNRDANRTPETHLNPFYAYDSPYMKMAHGEDQTTVNHGGQIRIIDTSCVPVGADTCRPIDGVGL
jgi:hypothetical protein